MHLILTLAMLLGLGLSAWSQTIQPVIPIPAPNATGWITN